MAKDPDKYQGCKVRCRMFCKDISMCPFRRTRKRPAEEEAQ